MSVSSVFVHHSLVRCEHTCLVKYVEPALVVFRANGEYRDCESVAKSSWRDVSPDSRCLFNFTHRWSHINPGDLGRVDNAAICGCLHDMNQQ